LVFFCEKSGKLLNSASIPAGEKKVRMSYLFSLMAEKALGNSETLGRFMQLNKQDIVNILNLAK